MTDVTQRLAAALHIVHEAHDRTLTNCNRLAREALAADPHLADDLALGSAFREVGEALPETRLQLIFDPTTHESRRYTAETDVGRGFGLGHYFPAPTATAALQALTKQLRGEK